MTEWLPERRIQCPYCGESISIIVDVSAGSQSYIEDCQVCCEPIEIRVDIESGNLENLRADRGI